MANRRTESGLVIFKLLEGELSHSNCHLELVMDDMRFPSYISSKAKSRTVKFEESESTSDLYTWVKKNPVLTP